MDTVATKFGAHGGCLCCHVGSDHYKVIKDSSSGNAKHHYHQKHTTTTTTNNNNINNLQ